jgi:hypothetical protein
MDVKQLPIFPPNIPGSTSKCRNPQALEGGKKGFLYHFLYNPSGLFLRYSNDL